MFRYLALWPLLMMKVKSDKTRVLVAILICSIIFGLYHASKEDRSKIGGLDGEWLIVWS